MGYINMLNDEKASIINFMKSSINQLENLQKEIPESEKLPLPNIPKLSALETPQLRYSPHQQRINEFYDNLNDTGNIKSKMNKLNVKKLTEDHDQEFEDIPKGNSNCHQYSDIFPDYEDDSNSNDSLLNNEEELSD